MALPTVHKKSWIGLAYDIANPPAGGSRTDDNRTSLRAIMRYMQIYYSEILTDELERKKQGILGFKVDDRFYNDLGCLPLTSVDKAECGCTIAGCTILRTDTMPKILTLFGKLMVAYVGDVDKQTPFTKTTAENVNASMRSRFGANLIHWYFKNDYIYIVIPKSKADLLISCINVQAITEDITAVMRQCRQDGSTFTPCFDIWSEEVNIPDRFLNRIRHAIWRNEMGLQLQAPHDDVNDGADIPKNQP